MSNGSLSLNMFESIAFYIENNMEACSIKYWTGFECMGCGIQRSIVLLLKGNAWASFQMYPALIPLVLTSILIVVDFFTLDELINKLLLYFYILTGTLIVGNFLIKTIITYG